jgi:hypothetical protein
MMDFAGHLSRYTPNSQRCRVSQGVIDCVGRVLSTYQSPGTCGIIGGMTPASDPPTYTGYRFPAEIISHAVWLYFRFSLSYRDVEELMAARGVVLTYETVRQWCRKFGQRSAKQLRRRRAQTGDKWHLDEVFLKINGRLHSLWRAVDQDGNVLDILVQSRWNKAAAKKFFRKLLKGCQYVPHIDRHCIWKQYSPPVHRRPLPMRYTS